MRLAEWREPKQMSDGGEHWARRTVATAITELAPDEDPTVFGEVLFSNASRPRVEARVWAAASIGLISVVLEHDPIGPDGTITIRADAWSSSLISSLRYQSSGSVENERPASLDIGDARLDADKRRRLELETFYRACIAHGIEPART